MDNFRKWGTYSRFTVLDDLNDLKVKASDGAEAVVEVCNNSDVPVPTSGSFPDTAGVSIRNADNVILDGLTFNMGNQTDPWYAAAVSNYSESGLKGDNFTVCNCTFNGGGAGNAGVFVNSGTTMFNVRNCKFSNIMKEAIGMYGDGTLLANASVTANTFTNCSFAIHGYYGGTGECGVLTFADNTVTGGNTYSKIVIQDQINSGAIKADVHGNTLTNAIVGLVNLRENGESVSPVLGSNTFNYNSFYVEAIEPGNINFYSSYQAPGDEKGRWELTGKEDFEVDWGENPDGTKAYIEDIIKKANEKGERELHLTGIDSDNLVKTFTWFKDGIYWRTLLDVYVSKIWADEENLDKIRPESITVRLYENGEQRGDPVVLSEENGWEHGFLNLNKTDENGNLINYTIDEAEVDGYTVQCDKNVEKNDIAFIITNTHIPSKIDIPVEKIWVDYDNEYGLRPESITVHLLANGKDSGKTLVLAEENDWKGSFNQLPEKDQNGAITYTVKEDKVDEYDVKIGYSPDTGYTITNTFTPKTEVKVKKVWDDKDDADGFRPDRVKVWLLANGEKIDSRELNATNEWSWTFADLPKFDKDNKKIEYKITEDPVKEYTTVITGNNENGYVITNTHEVKDLDIPVEKVWKDGNDSQGKRPDSVTIYLYADGKDTGKKLVLTSRDNWKGTFEDLPIYKDGKEIKYTIKEKDIPKYHGRIKGDAKNGFTVTNYYETSIMSPFTGDNIMTTVTVLTVSGIALVGLLVYSKKKKK